MRKMGRSRGRARERALSKAYSRGAAAAFATANRSAQPRRVALGDAINALTAGPGRTNGLVIDDETRWMMRDPRDDTDFGPINPLRPDAIDPVRPDTRRPEPRLSEYPVAWNLPGSADQPVPWATLRAAAENVDIMRRCISVRKEQLQGLDWSITLDDQTVQGMHAAAAGDTGREDIEAELRRKLLPEIDRLTTFWRNPWKANGVSFEQWVNGIMEDHLVLDAVSIYPRTTYGGELSAFELIDPTTIKLLIDYRGARPVAPFPAFQQILYGFPRAEFGSCYEADGDDAVKPVEGLLADQLFYFREEYRSFTPYGYSAVQQALISARLYLRRQGWMLAEYDDGSTPLTFLVPDATDGTLVEQLTPKTRRQWEDSINAELAGQTRARNRMKVLMPGMTPHQMTGVDERYKPDYDMHLIKMLAGHFGVTSTGLGFSESKGLGNSGLHEGQERTQDAATTKPDKRMIERIVNELMCTYQGAPAELRFKFTDPDTEDQAAEDASADAQRARGTITLNDDRKRIGKAPFPFPEADMPMVKVGDGWMPLEGMAQRAEQQAEAEQALVEDQLANSEAQREATATEAEELSGETAEKALELAAYRRWARKRGGDARRPFICKALAPSDFPGEQVPHDVDFAEWEWVPDGLADDCETADIVKAFGGNDNWRTLARDSRGRWVKRGSMRIDALGPSTPDKPVIASLRADAERRRAASSFTDAEMAEARARFDRQARGDGTSSPEAKARLMRSAGITPESIAARLRGEREQAEAEQRAKRDAQRAADAEFMAGVTADEIEAGKARHLARMRHAHAELYGTSDPDRLPPMAREQIDAIHADWADREKLPQLVRVDRASRNSQLPVSDASSTMGGMTTPIESARAARTAASARVDALAAARRDGDKTPENLAALDAANAELNAATRAVVAAERAERERTGVDAVDTSAARVRGREGYTSEGDEMSAQDARDAAERAKIREGFDHAGTQEARIVARQDQSVRDAVTSLQDAPGGWVSMVDVRRKLDDAGLSRAEQDAAIRRLATEGDRALNMAPEDNQKTLTDEEMAAAVDFGAGPQHVLSLDPPRRSVLDTVREEGRHNNPGFALPTTPPAARTEAIAAQTPDAPSAAPRTLTSKELSDMPYAQRTSRESFRAALRERGWSDAEVDAEIVSLGAPLERPMGGDTLDFSTRTSWAIRDRADAERAEAMRAATPTAFRNALDGDAPQATRPADRKVFEQMRGDGWVITDAGAGGYTFTHPGDDARHITAQAGKDGKWTFFAGQRKLTGKAAIEHTAPPSPAARAEAVAASTPDAPMSAAEKRELSRRLRALDAEVKEREATDTVALSKKQRDMAARFDKLAGEHAADPDVALWRERAIALTGEMEQVGRGAMATREADAIRAHMEQVQYAFTHAMTGARAAAAVRGEGGDDRAQRIARRKAELDSRARQVQQRLDHLERQIKDYSGESRKILRKRINDAKAERQRYLDRIERVERDIDTKLIYDADGKLSHLSYEPPQ